MTMTETSVIDTLIGKLKITTQENHVTKILFASRTETLKPPTNKFSQEVIKQIKNYFKNSQHEFTVPIEVNGTPFQNRVWQALQKIPSGKTLTYGELAQKLKTSPRAIGNACRMNPIPIIIPCHRIVGKQTPGGFCGKTSGKPLETKAQLLKHEKLA